MQVAKTAPVTFPAHSFVVVNRSSILADLCVSGGGATGGSIPISIDNVSPDIFRLLLSYIYNVKISR